MESHGKLYPTAGVSFLALPSFQHSGVKVGYAPAGTCKCSSVKRKRVLFTEAIPPPVQSLYTPTSYTFVCRQVGIRSYLLPLPGSKNFMRQVKASGFEPRA